MSMYTCNLLQRAQLGGGGGEQGDLANPVEQVSSMQQRLNSGGLQLRE